MFCALLLVSTSVYVCNSTRDGEYLCSMFVTVLVTKSTCVSNSTSDGKYLYVDIPV